MKDGDKPWSDDDVTLLRTMWDAPDKPSAAAIGRRLHRSASSIAGKAHRLDLTPRPSPIKQGLQPGSIMFKRATLRIARGASTLPPMQSELRTSAPSAPNVATTNDVDAQREQSRRQAAARQEMLQQLTRRRAFA